ncbi:MAG: cobalamin B12-binding domain-containing protein, partial [Bdellovibrionota bacterium]
MSDLETEIRKRLRPSQANIHRVLLIRPPDVDHTLFTFDAARRKRHSNYPPYGILVLATSLKSIGVEVEILDLHHATLVAANAASNEAEFDFERVWKKLVAEALARFKPDLAGVTCMFTMTHASFVAVCNEVLAQKVPLAVGGVHISNNLDFVLSEVPGIDFAFMREADRSFPAFVQAVNGKQPFAELGQLTL